MKACLLFLPDCGAAVTIPLSRTEPEATTVFGIGGTHTFVGPVQVTLVHAPWTLGQPTMTIQTPGGGTTTPVLPAGLAHGPASGTASTAQLSGVVQLVTATKV